MLILVFTKLDRFILRRILSLPIEALYLESGCLDIFYNIFYLFLKFYLLILYKLNNDGLQQIFRTT
jgi:hypothetical protein